MNDNFNQICLLQRRRTELLNSGVERDSEMVTQITHEIQQLFGEYIGTTEKRQAPFAVWLRHQLCSMDMTTEELSEHVHVSRATVSSWINGHTFPHQTTKFLKLARTISKFTKTDINQVLFDMSEFL